MADPTGDPLTELDAAVTKAGAGFATAMTDDRNFGVAKFWAMNALRQGVDPRDEAGMGRFLDAVRAGKVDYNDEALSEITARHVHDGGGRPERAVATLPVTLPPDAELAAAAEETAVVARLRALVEWVGDGRALTATGNLKLADARALVELLDTGDEFDREVGGEIYRTRSSEELTVLSSLIELAKTIRVVRVVKGKLVRVAKNARLLRDSLGLWTAAFDRLASPELVLNGRNWAPRYSILLASIIDEVLPDVLNTLYSFPRSMPIVRLQETVWLSVLECFAIDDLDEASEQAWREGVGADLRRVFTTLAEFDVVTLTTGVADPVFSIDLDPGGPGVFSPATADRLRSALSADSVELIALTPLARRAVRQRMIAAGRHAPLVGELSGAEPSGLLGVLADHYPQEAAAAELAGWLDAHGGRDRGLPLLMDAVRRCPIRSRATAMLDVLAWAIPDGTALLRELRSDRKLAPIAMQLLVERGELALEELSDDERLRGVAEQFIHLLELGGPDQVAASLNAMPPDEARGLVTAVLNCGHPDEAGIAELRELLARRRPGATTGHPLAGVSRSSRKARRNGKYRR
ncbi:hypothetical protein [Amycolatopsis benzoatilytica]|uniref:hypothetical protein n=1 Tax=Amycolatopsis benzoatilytica TaxID=346045 RepID=UPI001B7FCE38|nr:hypothetical protein [Amycolatopsis benzoatilytica]